MNYLILFLLAIIIFLLVVVSKLIHKVKSLELEKGLLSQIIMKE